MPLRNGQATRPLNTALAEIGHHEPFRTFSGRCKSVASGQAVPGRVEAYLGPGQGDRVTGKDPVAPVNLMVTWTLPILRGMAFTPLSIYEQDCTVGQPSYIELHEQGLLGERIRSAQAMMTACRVCPRACEVNRLQGETGVCRTGAKGHGVQFWRALW